MKTIFVKLSYNLKTPTLNTNMSKPCLNELNTSHIRLNTIHRIYFSNSSILRSNPDDESYESADENTQEELDTIQTRRTEVNGLRRDLEQRIDRLENIREGRENSREYDNQTIAERVDLDNHIREVRNDLDRLSEQYHDASQINAT